MAGFRKAILQTALAVTLGLHAFTATAQQGQTLPEPAQSSPPPLRSPILTVDEERIFTESHFGKSILAARDADAAALNFENRKIEADLEEEERALTSQRAKIPKADFAPLSAAFNAKVEGIRKAQETKLQELSQRFEDQRRRFSTAAVPVLGQIMAERGALAIVSKRAILIGVENVDITAAAIARLDETLGDGGNVPAPAPRGPLANPQP
jgi:Skp family chaperone for outer membrane proteins